MDDIQEPAGTRPTKIVADEAWDWVERSMDEPPIDVSKLTVTAVLVTHNAAAWLPETLQSLRSLTVAPRHLVAVDTDSDDATLSLLRRSGLCDLGLAGSADDGFGSAVAKGLHALRADRSGDTPWLWLLHDDIVAHPDALRRLLECAVTHPEADIIGPKLLQPGAGDGPHRISELGVSISDTGRRESRLEPGEIDQQQHSSHDSLGVGTCGMLVRRGVFDALDGLAPELPVFRDGVEFGWRATAAGYRVRTCPEAVIVHRRAGRLGLRPSRLIGSDPEATDRLLGMRTVAAHRGPLASVRLTWGSLLRALGFLLAKAPSRSASELRALRAFCNRAPVRSMRARIAEPVDAAAADRVRALRPPWWSGLGVAADSTARAVSDRWQRSAAQRAATSLDELTGDEFAASTDRPERHPLTNPFVLALGVLLLAAVIAARGLIRPGVLGSDILLPTRPTLGGAYDAYLLPIVGAPGMAPPPWLGWTALASTLTLGQPDWFVTLLLLAGVPLTFLSAMLLLHGVVSDPRTRLAGAVAYALVPVWLGAVNRGVLEVAVAAPLLPLLAIALRALVLRRTHGPESWRSAWASGLLLAILLAFAPVLSPLVVIGAVAGAIGLRRDRPRLMRLAVAAAVPAIVLAPWLPTLARSWSRLLVGPDAGLRSLAVAEPWQLMIGRTPGPGLPPLWLGLLVFGLIWLVAAFGVACRPHTLGVWAAWGTAVCAFALAVLLAGRLATVLPQGTRARPDIMVCILVGFGALVLAAVLGLGRFAAAVSERGFGVLRLSAVAIALVTAGALLAGIVWWATAGATGPLRRTPVDELPAFIRSAMLSEARTRTLAIEFHEDTPHWSLVDGDQHRLGDADRGLAFGGSGSMQQRTASIVARLVSGAGDERVAEDLASVAVGHVWVRGATEEQRSRITNTPGLGAAAAIGDIAVWTVPGTVGRYAITGGPEARPVPSAADASATVDLPASDHTRTLVLHEPTDPRWRITFDDEELPARTVADRTLADLPTRAGRLEVRLPAPLHSWMSLAQLLVVATAAVLAAPSLAGRRQRAATGVIPTRREDRR